MKLSRALSLGVAGSGLILIVLWIGGQIAGTEADLCTVTAALLFGDTGPAAWVGALGIQLLLGGIAAVVYAGFFEYVAERAGALLGLAVAVPHVLFAGLVVGFLPASPMIDVGVMPPGAFYEYRGLWCIAAFIIGHLAFGLLAGMGYGATRHAYPKGRRLWAESPRAGSAP